MLTSNVPGLPKPLRLRSDHLGALGTLGNARKASGAQRCVRASIFEKLQIGAQLSIVDCSQMRQQTALMHNRGIKVDTINLHALV